MIKMMIIFWLDFAVLCGPLAALFEFPLSTNNGRDNPQLDAHPETQTGLLLEDVSLEDIENRSTASLSSRRFVT
ncbi:hypothetical protein ACQKEN_03560 [Pseudomonas sp. NPDC078416]|uniref:hypothetical protein n=1 Tax=Pseudomonas sp. NPDC078416 TaxID=3390637 RepID=UPI003D03749E